MPYQLNSWVGCIVCLGRERVTYYQRFYKVAFLNLVAYFFLNDYFSTFSSINNLIAESEKQLHGLLALFLSDFITSASSAV